MADGIARGVGLEFKPKYHKTTTTKKDRKYLLNTYVQALF
jgi:hypothetical protein